MPNHIRPISANAFDYIAKSTHNLDSMIVGDILPINRGDNLILTKHGGEGAIGVIVEFVNASNNIVIFRRTLEKV